MRLACSEEKRRAGSAMYDLSDEHFKLHAPYFFAERCAVLVFGGHFSSPE